MTTAPESGEPAGVRRREAVSTSRAGLPRLVLSVVQIIAATAYLNYFFTAQVPEPFTAKDWLTTKAAPASVFTLLVVLSKLFSGGGRGRRKRDRAVIVVANTLAWSCLVLLLIGMALDLAVPDI